MLTAGALPCWVRERVAALAREEPDDAVWRKALLDHLSHLVGAVAGALVADDRSVPEEAVEWLDVVMRHRHGPDDLIVRVLPELRAVLREYPSRPGCLSGTLGAAGTR